MSFYSIRTAVLSDRNMIIIYATVESSLVDYFLVKYMLLEVYRMLDFISLYHLYIEVSVSI